ncbi:MAG: glutamine--tRNA ligase [Zetaproteobacteria bacterium]|nr:glutamine--tRNA ligase [Pseudobdellovibrionaceae bacterium]
MTNIINDDLAKNKNSAYLTTRFPPEPNGFLHIGHAKSICLNFGLSEAYEKSHCNLRFDDTNPSKEDILYEQAIIDDVKWLGFKWDKDVKYASDYFEELFDCGVQLIKQGQAYVCDLSAKEIKEYRGTLTEAGKNSPFRTRSVEENLALFHEMKQGKFKDGEKVLRAKIDMSSGNINMRDPILYRIMKIHHSRTKDKWCIYPTYDFTHCLSDSIENITHSLCTLEFQDHRPLYDWVLHSLKRKSHPQQIEFARLCINYGVTSKRKIKLLVDKNIVDGWDDPRILTLAGLRRRGYTPKAIRNFCHRIGISKKETIIDMSILEECIRNDLNDHAPRRMSVLDPLKIIITNYPQGKVETLQVPHHPQKSEMGYRSVLFSREIYIEQDDFLEEAPKKFFRLAPGQEVRLRYSYVIKCEEVVKDKDGVIKELRCTYDPETLGKKPEGRKVKGVIHWLSCGHSEKAHVRIYDRLFTKESPSSDEKDFLEEINESSLVEKKNAYIEKNIEGDRKSASFQFERLGYFCLDKTLGGSVKVFNRTVSLKDTWAKSKES